MSKVVPIILLLVATTQARDPWSLSQCDKLVGRPVIAVFNVSTWNAGGWPLWRVTCLYR